MVQIMSENIGHCSRNRAERASLDGKPEYPDATATAISTHIPNLPPSILSSGPGVTYTNATEDEEYEDYGHTGTRGSTSEETNNNLSDSEKDWGFVADPWAATSSFVTPQFDDNLEDDNLASDINPSTLATKGSTTINNTQSLQPHRSPPTTSSCRNYTRSIISKKRRRKKPNKGSSSGGSTVSRKSTKSLQPKRTSPILTRRRSTQSFCADFRHIMDVEVAPNIDPAPLTPESARNISEVETETASAVPYCYRCFLKFAKYSHWKKHAIYEHILAKNPYPIVEMNYIDPTSLGIEVPPNVDTIEDGLTFGEKYAEREEDSFIDGIVETANFVSEESNTAGLKLCIGKEKGAYVVKRKSLGSDDNCPPPALDVAPDASQFDASSPSLNSMPMVMPMLKPCPIMTTNTQADLQLQKIKPAIVHPSAATVNLEAPYQNMVSIEAELETDLNIEIDEFEKALEMATELSRISSSSPTMQKSLPAAGSGGVAIPGGITSFNSNSKMISEDVPISSPAIAVDSSENKDLSFKEPETTSLNLLSKLLHRQETSQGVSVEGSKISEANESLAHNLASSKSANDSSDEVESRESGEDTEHSDKNKTSIFVEEEFVHGSIRDINSVQNLPIENDAKKDKDESEHTSRVTNVKEILSSEVETSKLINTDNSAEESQTKENEDSVATLPESPQADDDGDGDDFECRICHKVFMSDEELSTHFSQDHFRLAEGVGILEPESPYPQPQTPQQQRSTTGDESSVTSEARPTNQIMGPTQSQAELSRSITTAHASNLNGPARVPNSTYQLNIARRLSSDNSSSAHPPPYGTAQEELQNMMWKDQVNAAAAHAQQQRNQGSVPRTFLMNPLIQVGPRPVGQSQMHGQRISPPNVVGGGIPRASTAHNQAMSRQPLHHFTNTPPRTQFGSLGGGQGQAQRLPMQAVQAHHRVSPPNYPMSLHNALTGMSGSPAYTQASMNHQRPGGMIQQRPTSNPIRQIHPNQYQQQQQNAMRCNIPNSIRGPNNVPLGSTIGMNQQVINHMNAQRELNNQFQQRLQNHHINPVHQSMPRLQQTPQQRSFQQQQQQQQYHQQQQQNNRVGPLSQKRPAQMMGIEISEVRSNKEPRVLENQLLIQRQVRPADARPVNSSGSSLLNQNVAAAIGSVGSAGVNSVRLGNSITLSVCPTTGSKHNSPTTSPALQESGSKQSSRSSSPATHHVSSVLAVRGVTVTPASPPITSISPASTPSPSNSPVVSSFLQHHQIQQQQTQASVIQRGPSSISPENPRDKNFSPPVITTVRGNAHPIPNANSNPGSQPPPAYNFAVPRPPPPIQRMQHSPSYAMGVTVNSSAERPERPPTVDLTDDDVQTHTSQAHQRISGVIPQNHVNQPIRRFVVAQAATFPQSQPRSATAHLPSCNICGLMFPSIMTLESHKLSSHSVPRTNPPSNMTSPPSAGPRPVGMTPSSSTARNSLPMSRPAMNPGHVVQPSVRGPLGPGSVPVRNHQPTTQIRAQSPNHPSISNSPNNNNQGKYLYIPLLDLGRMDANKMRKLEEIGISCVVPLQGNNAMSQMGIPVMNLRGEGALGQHVPWDSVLPMGPVHQPMMNEQGNGNNRVNNNINSSASSPNNNNNNAMSGGPRFH